MKERKENFMRRLIIVEGLPCSGKSTTAKFIADTFHMEYVDEGTGDHPADYEFHAFIKNNSLRGFSAEEQKRIRANAAETLDGYVVPLGRFQGELFQKLLPFKIYDGLPWETERPVMLEKWRGFAAGPGLRGRYVFNCVLLQNPMCETMMRFGMEPEASAQYIGEICQAIRPLDPFILYLKSDDIRVRIENSLSERGSEWLEGVIAYHCEGAFGKARRLKGFEGYIAALEERQRRELEILNRLPVPHRIQTNPDRDWSKAYHEICSSLQ